MRTENRLSAVMSDVVKKAKSLFGDRLGSVILYGSYARGDYDEESDIDVMITADISPEETARFGRELTDYSVDVALANNVVLSIILQDCATYEKYKNSYPFFMNIEKEGVKLIA